MTEAEFGVFLARATEALEVKQAALGREYGFGGGGRWWFEQESERLQLFDAEDRLTVECDVIDIGSYAPAPRTWMWGWANPSLLPSLRERAAPLKALEALTGFAMFGRDVSFAIDGEAMAWELAAIAVMHLGALGCYRAPASSGASMSFLAIMTAQPGRT